MKNISLLFSGQGSQYVGMGKKLYDNYSIVKDLFEEASDIIDLDLKKLCFEGGMKELSQTENTQPAIVTVSVAQFKVYMEEIGIEPQYLAGHSLGELSALACSGAIAFSDVIRLAQKRGKYMKEAAKAKDTAMVALSGIFAKEKIEQMCDEISNENERVVISNYNSPLQIVVSGDINPVMQLKDRAENMGIKTNNLNVSGPFHTPLMDIASENFREELKKYKFNKIKWPVISNVSGLPYGEIDSIVDNLSMQIVKPVQWEKTMKYLKDNRTDTTIELGPKQVLKKLTQKNVGSIDSYAYDLEDDFEYLLNFVGKKVRIYDNFFSKCIAVAVCTKNNNWNNAEYEKGVVENYRKLEEMEANYNQTGIKNTDDIKRALEYMDIIFKTKKLSIDERNSRFHEILFDTNTQEALKDFVNEKYINN